MKYAIVENGLVKNVVLADAPLGAGWVETDEASIGDVWDGVEFTKPAIPVIVPDEVPMWAARHVLIGAGLMQPILDALAAMPGIDGEIARSDFEYAPNIVRASPFITYAQNALGMTSTQMDDLFFAAQALVSG